MHILQVSCNYLPRQVGGTEVYVHALSKALLRRGWEISAVFIDYLPGEGGPQVRIEESSYEGIRVYRIACTCTMRTRDIYFSSFPEVRKAWEELIVRIRPELIHSHHFSPTDIADLTEIASSRGIPFILTYHTPKMTCAWGEMCFGSQDRCEGKLNLSRCLYCVQRKFKVPSPLAWSWAHLPWPVASAVGRIAEALGVNGKISTWLQLPWLYRRRMQRWEKALSRVTTFVAVCNWVQLVLENLGIPREKIVFSRQGIDEIPHGEMPRPPDDVFRVAYMGRTDPVKGIDVLCRAFQLIPRQYRMELRLYAAGAQSRSDREYALMLQGLTRKDPRIIWEPVVLGQDKFRALAGAHCVAIPSLWLETGPLVLLESWAVSTPVVGSRLGGIAELLKEGEGGVLCGRGNAEDFARVFMRMHDDRQYLLQLKSRIPRHIRTMDDVGEEMDALYRKTAGGAG